MISAHIMTPDGMALALGSRLGPYEITARIGAVCALAAGALSPIGRGRKQAGYRTRGQWWGRLIGSPWSGQPALQVRVEVDALVNQMIANLRDRAEDVAG